MDDQFSKSLIKTRLDIESSFATAKSPDLQKATVVSAPSRFNSFKAGLLTEYGEHISCYPKNIRPKNTRPVLGQTGVAELVDGVWVFTVEVP